jgi:hypothetical protein
VRSVAEVDDDRGLPQLGHALGRLADRGVRRAYDGCAADELADRAAAGVERSVGRAPIACARPGE